MRRPAALAASVVLSFLALPAAAAGPGAGKKPLTLEVAAGQPPLVSRGPSGLAFRDAGRLTFVLSEGFGPNAKSALWEVDVATGKKTLLLEPPAVPAEPGGKEAEGKPARLSLAGAQWNAAGTALLLSGADDLWIWDAATKAVRRLTRGEAEEEVATFSPDGSRVAFVRDNDLFTVDVATGKETRLTRTGETHLLNGKLDWVYEEELAGRRSGRSYEWAPDGKAIAYLRLDERRVPEHPIVDYFPTNGKVEPQRYPKAGDPNSIPSVHVVDLGGAETASVTFSPDDVLVGPELFWTADSASAGFLLLDRTQTRLEVKLVARGAGAEAAARTLLTETDPAWVNSVDAPVFLEDGSGFLFVSERSGFLHVYRFSPDGKLRNAVTQGPWMVDRDWEVDEKGGFVWFVGTEKDPRERHVYRVRLDGKGLTRVTEGRGWRSLTLSPDGKHFVEGASDAVTPSRTTLRRADGKAVAVLADSNAGLSEYQLGAVELGSFTGSDGTLFYTKLVKPADFDPSRKYPVVVSVYGGPHAQMVADRFGSWDLFDQLLAQKGFLVFSVDGRGSWGRGHAFETPVLKRLGEVELADQVEGVAWLKKQPFVDGGRIGVWGWSYGGTMAVKALLDAGDVFKVGVAGAPVTDWKLYDSIYTDRYMKLPKENADGYEATSLLEAAGKLTGKLQILHGTSDDNVHIQNSILLLDAFARARKEVDFVPLPRQKHGPREPAYRLFAFQRALAFFERNL
ncbi:MAG: S9 family peptidase [Acidobacteria bacterium]|nr:MAG: S9 family peptidase [Acidobacteriota bacterium]MCE7958197.1 S9 family peptidase [Acidobacteria bacterium ACB2]